VSLVHISPSQNARFPAQPFHHLDALWIQVAGTVCNLACTHCFVRCGPGETRHDFMSRAEVAAVVTEAAGMGVKEIYFTGGEPFLHDDLETILADTLLVAPCTVLTNGTLLLARRVAALASLARTSRYSLEIRVSLDGADAAAHDAFRGEGAFRRALDGVRSLAAAGLLPIVTATQARDEEPLAFRERWLAMLRAEGIAQPRLKVLPMFLLGREATRTRAYRGAESLSQLPPEAFDAHRLQCGACRAVTSRGVFVCPLLVDEPGGRMGESLADSARPFELRHGACHTCWVTGMTCANG